MLKKRLIPVFAVIVMMFSLSFSTSANAYSPATGTSTVIVSGMSYNALPAAGMSDISVAFTNLTTLVGDVFDMITTNWLLSIFVAASLTSVAFGVLKKAKKAAR